MALKLDDLLKKAKAKGYGLNQPSSLPETSEMVKTWQQESVLYSDTLENKPNTNITQTRHKPNTKRYTNLTQTQHKLDTEKIQTRHKPNTQRYTELDTNLTQTRHKLDTNEQFSCLTGIQRIMVIFLFQQCKISRQKVTEGLSPAHIANTLKIRIGSVKTTVIRLEQKGFIRRASSKEGRGGWSCYEIPDKVYSELLEIETRHKLDTNLTQTLHKLDTERYTERYTTPSSSSSNIITTTTELSDEWQKINTLPLESIGLNSGHLTQLQRLGVTSAEIVQDSIDHFSYDLLYNNKGKEIKTNAIGYFMGIMKRAGVYTAPDNYESEKDRSLRIYLETKKLQQEKQAVMEAEIIEVSYNEWIAGLTEDQKRSLLPDHALNSKLEGPKIAALKTHYKKNIWPSKKITLSFNE